MHQVKKYVMGWCDEATGAPEYHVGKSRTRNGRSRNGRVEKGKKDQRGVYRAGVLIMQRYYML